MTTSEVPEDEPWRVWHRVASEQLVTVVSGMTSDPFPVLWRARDFAERALTRATPLEALVTTNLVNAIDQVQASLVQET